MLKKNSYFYLLFLFFLIIFFEITSFALCKILNICKNPTYSFSNQSPRHFVDVNKDFGVWHKNNSSYNHKSECFNVTYKFNSYGARDKERPLEGLGRTILIGDSFVEGYGVKNEDTISSNLEILSGNDFLNFGTSGHFGSTQYRLLYDNLAKNFQHDKLIVFISVNNDFEDDSHEFGKIYHKNRYRPYLIENNNDYKIIYFDENKINNKSVSENKKIINFLNNFTYSYNLLRYFKQKIYYLIDVKKYNKSLKTVEGISEENNDTTENTYYERYSEKSYEILKYNLTEINKLVKDNNIDFWLISVGFEKEIRNLSNKKKKLKLVKNLEEFSKVNQFNYFDLTKLLNKNYKGNVEDLFFKCDHHYNGLANNIISKIIFEEISNK